MRKVLLVDDDPRIREVLGGMLSKAGCEVIKAGSVGDGLALSLDADVILLDLVLGKESGETFLEKLRKAGLYTPVIVMSGIVPKERALERLQKYKIIDFIFKPVSSDELSRKLENAEKVSGDIDQLYDAAEKLKAAATSLNRIARQE